MPLRLGVNMLMHFKSITIFSNYYFYKIRLHHKRTLVVLLFDIPKICVVN